jgi:hypothetical protein
MDNPGRLFGQIAAEAQCSANRAKVAVYLMGLSRDGRSVSEACTALRRSEATIKDYAREFMIDFSDYRPFARMRDKGEHVKARTGLGMTAR